MKSMRISVAMCTYNGQRFLKEQVQSIATQTVLPHELVVCDDGSQDATVKIVEAFAASAPFEVRLIINDRNLGSSRNFEKAITLCRGELIALSDQDDIWRIDKLECMRTAFEADPSLGGVFSDGSFVDQDSKPQGGSLWKSVRLPLLAIQDPNSFARVLLRGDSVTGATLMLRTSCRDILLPIAQPWVHDGWLAWMLLLQSKISAIDMKLIQYRIHKGQQLGLSNASLFGRLAERREKPEQLRHIAEEFEVLLEHYQGIQRKRFPWLEAALREKIAHFRRRSELPSTRLKRLIPVLRQLPSYSKYSSVRGNLIRDLLWR